MRIAVPFFTILSFASQGSKMLWSSVTRLGSFLKALAMNLLTKGAQ